jgi:hypothetical protein
MNLIRRRMVSFLTEAVHKELEALGPQSPYAKELHEVGDVDTAIAQEIEKICDTATLAEITKVFSLVRRLKKAPANKRETIKSELNSTVEELAGRVESLSGPLRLRETCRGLLLNL